MAKKMIDEDRTGGITPDDFLKHYRDIRMARVPMEKAAALYRIARKTAKSAGVSLDALSLMENLSKMDPDEARAMLKQFGIYSAVTKQGYAEQLDLFGVGKISITDKSAAIQAAFDAEEAGRLCGAKGGNKNDCPHEVGSELHVKWDAGFNNGWEFWEASGGPATRTKTATGRGRGKPPGVKAKVKDAKASVAPHAPAAAAGSAPSATLQ